VGLFDLSNESTGVVIEAKLKQRGLQLVIASFARYPVLVATIAVLCVDATDDIQSDIVADLT
jgi:hypothetical protein